MRASAALVPRRIGEVLEPLDDPQSSIRHTIRNVPRTLLAGQQRALSATLRDPVAVARTAQSVIGEYRGLVAPRDFFTARSSLSKHVLHRGGRGINDLDLPTRKWFYTALTALVANAGGSKWERNYTAKRLVPAAPPGYAAMADIVAAAVGSSVRLDPVVLKPRDRPTPADVIANVISSAERLAGWMAAAEQERALANRLFDLVDAVRYAGDPRLDPRPFEPFLALANFYSRDASVAPPPVAEAAFLATQAPRIYQTLVDHPDYMLVSADAFASRYNIERFYSQSTSDASAVVITRSYAQTNVPAVLVIQHKLEDDTAVASTVPNPQGSTDLDRVITSTEAFAGEVGDLLQTALEEANPARKLIIEPDIEEHEARMLASCIADVLSYSSSANSAARLLEFVARREPRLTNWEDLVSMRADGLYTTNDYRVVLLLAPARAGGGAAPVDEVALANIGADTVYCEQAFDTDEVILGDAAVPLTVSYPVYTLTPGGLHATSRDSTEPGLLLNVHQLAGLGATPVDAYALVPHPPAIARTLQLLWRADLWRRLSDPAEDIEADITTVGVARLPLWGFPGVDEAAHRERARELGVDILKQAVITMITGETIRRLYASALRSARPTPIPYKTPRVRLEAEVMYDSAIELAGSVFPAVLGHGVREVFEGLVAIAVGDPSFQSRAITRILKPAGEPAREPLL